MSTINTNEPFWGPVTAKSKHDYAITRYIAEFINTLSNVVYIIYGIYGLRKLNKNPKADILRALPYWGLMAVGVCSAAFHLSMKYHTQMMDDLSMLFATTPVLHRVLTVDMSREASKKLAILMWTLLLIFITYHVWTDELILHFSLFAGMIITIGVRTMQLVNLRTVPGSAARAKIGGIIRFGAFIFSFGFGVWVLENCTCDALNSARRAVGLPFGFLLELHGWWHICTGIGAYIFIASVDLLASGEEVKDIEGSFAWPAPWASRSIFAGKEVAVDKRARTKND
ncbi:alkaline phytoceramidase [Aspergillus karnatakaensis]|uniref:ceramidase n=1 Tax=Aspergillus karnatakaensis TaxID=1810916 RepID=UPI003CCD02A2